MIVENFQLPAYNFQLMTSAFGSLPLMLSFVPEDSPVLQNVTLVTPELFRYLNTNPTTNGTVAFDLSVGYHCLVMHSSNNQIAPSFLFASGGRRYFERPTVTCLTDFNSVTPTSTNDCVYNNKTGIWRFKQCRYYLTPVIASECRVCLLR